MMKKVQVYVKDFKRNNFFNVSSYQNDFFVRERKNLCEKKINGDRNNCQSSNTWQPVPGFRDPIAVIW